MFIFKLLKKLHDIAAKKLVEGQKMIEEEMRAQRMKKLENLTNIQNDNNTTKRNSGATSDNFVQQTVTHNAKTVNSNFRSGEQYTLQYL